MYFIFEGHKIWRITKNIHIHVRKSTIKIWFVWNKLNEILNIETHLHVVRNTETDLNMCA